jgi:NAD(P)-dependent dehydrogenase (short-subunit alcohol dehydrogenase family)
MPGVRDRVAVVTGAANGLGREIALLLARGGARVALGDLDAAGLDKTAAAITAVGGACAPTRCPSRSWVSAPSCAIHQYSW